MRARTRDCELLIALNPANGLNLRCVGKYQRFRNCGRGHIAMKNISYSVFYRYLVRPACAAAAISALSLIERALMSMNGVTGSRTFPSWDSVIEFAMHSGITQDSGVAVPIYRYLLRPDAVPSGKRKDKPVRLKAGGDQGPVRNLSKLISLIANKFARGPAFQAASRLNNQQQQAVSAFKKLCDEKWYESAIKALEGASPSSGAQIDDVRLEKFLSELSTATSGIAHPDFPGLPLICSLTIACEFHGLASKRAGPRKRSGLFAVVREARGWTVEHGRDDDINLIVRDLLWVEDLDLIVTAGAGDVHGLYYSVYDNALYTVQAKADVDLYRPTRNVVVTANMEPGKREHGFHLFFPMRENAQPMSARDGIISGTARTPEQLAAWKVLLIEPNWPESDKLETLITLLHERQEIARLPHCLVEGKYCGVLYRQINDKKHKEQMERRDGFRRLVRGDSPSFTIEKTFGGYLRDEIVQAISNQINEAINNPKHNFMIESISDETINDYAEKILGDFDKILQNRWHLVEPTQIITFVSEKNLTEMTPSDRQERERMIERLLVRTDIEPR